VALTDFREEFDNAYQEVFQKVLVAKPIMNTRFQSQMKFGESLERVAYDISGVAVRSVTRGSASTIDTITDSTETLNVNLEYEAVFHISDGEVTQAGPLNPGEVIGGQVGHKVAAHLDGKCFAETLNATYDFDAGDLTTLSSDTTPITLSSTTVPQMVTRMPAKLKYRNNQTGTNMAFVVDAYAAADIEQYLLGKQFAIVESVFQNGYAGPISTAEVYVSENLTGELTFAATSTPGQGETFTILGVTFTVSTSATAAGEINEGSAAGVWTANVATAINAYGATTAVSFACSAADQATLRNADISADTTADGTIYVRARGRIIATESLTGSAISNNCIHAYFGKKGAIDLVIQDLEPVDMRATDDRRGTNVFSSYLAGLKTFADGAKKFLDVLIAV
jgi:hypothetical protein